MPDEAGILFLLVVMKIPVFYILWLIYAAMRAEPEIEGGDEGWGDSKDPCKPPPCSPERHRQKIRKSPRRAQPAALENPWLSRDERQLERQPERLHSGQYH